VRLPPETILLAAKRWLEVLPSSGGVPRARTLLTTATSYNDLTPTQYATAYSWLENLGLLAELGSPVPPANQVLAAVLERAAPPWLRDADDLVQSPDEVPSDFLSAGELLGLDEDEVFGQVISSWGKVDTAARERVGEAGELGLVEMLRGIPDSRVEQVSSWSDGFGYDIEFSQGPVEVHLEVKSTTRIGRFTAYLSRNEFNVMLRDQRWILVTLRLSPEFDVVGVGSVAKEWIAANVPRDFGPFGSWASCKLDVPAAAINEGIPELGSRILRRLPSW